MRGRLIIFLSNQILSSSMARDRLEKIKKDHARLRFLQRYGLVMSEVARRELIERVKWGDTKVLARRSYNKCSVHLVDFRGVDVVFVYSHKDDTIKTFLPFDNLERYLNAKEYASFKARQNKR